MLFDLDFVHNTILSGLFFFFLIIALYFLIPEAITHIVNPIAELVIPKGIPSKEAKAEIEIHQVIVESKISKFPISFRVAQNFLCFLLINSFCFISLRK